MRWGKFIIAGFLVLLILFSGCVRQQPAELRPFTSEEGGFSVMLPSEPKYEAQTLESPAGPITMHSYMSNDGVRVYGVSYSDYPDAVLDADPQTVLDGVVNGAVANTHGTLLATAPISLGGYPGREVNISAGEVGSRMRFYLVGKRLYSNAVAGAPADLGARVVDEVISSFKLTSSQSIE